MKFHFVKISMTVAIAVITVAFNVFSPAAALAASASAIDRQATRRWRCWFSRASSKEVSSLPANSVTGRCARTESQSPIIGRWRRPTDSRPEFKPLATCCFSWTMHRFNISTTVPAGNWEQDPAWWCWTLGSARIYRRQRCRRACMLLFSTRKG